MFETAIQSLLFSLVFFSHYNIFIQLYLVSRSFVHKAKTALSGHKSVSLHCCLKLLRPCHCKIVTYKQYSLENLFSFCTYHLLKPGINHMPCSYNCLERVIVHAKILLHLQAVCKNPLIRFGRSTSKLLLYEQTFALYKQKPFSYT